MNNQVTTPGQPCGHPKSSIVSSDEGTVYCRECKEATELLGLAKRLADYVRLTIEIGGLKPDSPIGIAYRDFIEEWDRRHLTSAAPDAASGDYQPTHSALDASNPPRGGSGVPPRRRT